MCEHTLRSVEEIRDEFAESCRQRLENSYTKRGLHFLCSVDGSETAHLAYTMCMTMRKKYDFVSVFHAYRNDQEGVPEQFRAEAIRGKYQHDLSLHMSPKYSTVHLEARGNRSVIDALKFYVATCDAAQNHPDFIVLGHAGRKCKGYFAPLSSNCDWVLRTIQIPCIIARKVSPPHREGKHWMMPVDGTVYSDRGLDMVLHLMGPRDRISLFYVFSDTEEEENLQMMALHYQEELEHYAPVGSDFTLVELEMGKDRKIAIAEYVNERAPEFLALGPRARTTQSLSTLTSYLINNVVCSIVVCKN